MKTKGQWKLVRRRCLAAGLVGLAVLLCSCGDDIRYVLSEKDGTAVVTGKVQPKGLKTTVSLVDAGVVKSTETDSATGEFVLEDVPFGNYKLVAESGGFGVISKIVHINDREEYVYTLYMKPFPSQVSAVSPEDSARLDSTWFGAGEYLRDSTLRFIVDFQTVMDTLSVREALSSSPGLRGLEAAVSFNKSRTRVTAEVNYRKLFGLSQVSFTLGKSAMTLYGENLDFPLVRTYFVDTAYYGRLKSLLLLASVLPKGRSRPVPLDEPITLIFSGRMLTQTVEDRFSIKPALPPNFFWEDYTGSRHKLTIRFGKPYESATVYTYILEAGMLSADSQTNEAVLEFSFTTENRFLESYYPLNGAESVPLGADFNYRLNFPLAKALFKQAFRITPPVEGLTFGTLSESRVILVKHDRLLPDTQYVIEVDSLIFGADTSGGMALVQKFRTVSGGDGPAGPFISPPNRENTPVGQQHRLIFPDSVRRGEVASRLRFDPAVPLQLAWDTAAGIEAVVLMPAQSLKTSTTYRIILDSGYGFVGGDTGRAFGFQFETAPLRVISYHPFIGKVNVPVTDSIVLGFNAFADSVSLAANLVIDPAPGGMTLSYTADTTGQGPSMSRLVVRHNGLAANMKVTVTLKQDATDIFGVPAGNPFIMTFTTRN